MICFSDTDILLKLISFGLLKQALTALGVTSEKDVYVTPEAAAKCRKSKRFRTDFRQETLNQALEFLKRATTITEPGDLEELNQLLVIEDEGIDAGEATLFLATKDQPDFIFITGDKRALCALTNNFLSQELHSRHLGHVLCLETILLLIIKHKGFSAVRLQLLAGRSCDKAVSNALPDVTTTEAEFIAVLEQYVARLDEETQGLLMKI